MLCPACDTELEAAPDFCPECGLSMKAVATALSLRCTADGMLVLAEFGNQMDADMLIQRLASVGIPAFLSGVNQGMTGGPIDLARWEPIRVLIWQRDGSNAVQLIAEDEQWGDDQLARYILMLAESTKGAALDRRHS